MTATDLAALAIALAVLLAGVTGGAIAALYWPRRT